MKNRPDQQSGQRFKKRATQRAAMLGVATVLVLPSAFGADDHLNLQEPKRPEYLTPKPDSGFVLPPVAPLPSTSASSPNEPSIYIKQIIIRGNTVISNDELSRVTASYTERNLNVAEIEELRQKLSRYYVDRGYVNSGALLGANAIAGDVLTFDIIEGRLTAIELRGLERLHPDYIRYRLVSDINAPLNMDVLRERFQLLLDDPLIDRINARLIPDSKLGEAILDVDLVRARPYQLSVLLNNYRPPSIGSNGVVVKGWVRNLTGRGDLLDVSVQDSTSLGEGTRGSIGWFMPLNQRGTQLSIQLDHGRSSVVEEPMQSLNIKSTLDSKDIGLSQNLIETLTHKLSVGINRVERENKTTLLGEPFSFIPGEPSGVTRISAWRFWQEYSYSSTAQVLALRSTFTSARNNLQDVVGLPVASQRQPDRSYGLWLGQAQYAQQVMENGAQFIARATVQQSNRALLALDQISIGGNSTVRGYRENQLIRDTGAIINLEFDYPLLVNTSGLNVSLIPFYDYGRGKNRDESAESLSSIGLATRVRWHGFSLDLALARRLSHPASVDDAKGSLQDKGIHVQVGYKFFGI